MNLATFEQWISEEKSNEEKYDQQLKLIVKIVKMLNFSYSSCLHFCKWAVACMCLSFLICNEKVKNKNYYMPHESFEEPTFTEDQGSTQKRKFDLVFCPARIQSCEKNIPIILYLQNTEMSFKFIRN